MPTQVYAVLGQPQPVQPVSALKAELMALTKALVTEATAQIPVLRTELQSVEQRLGAQLALACTAFENLEQRTNDLYARLQTLQTLQQEKEERGKKRPALRLTPSLPITMTPTQTEAHRGYHDPTASSLRGAPCGGAAADHA